MNDKKIESILTLLDTIASKISGTKLPQGNTTYQIIPYTNKYKFTTLINEISPDNLTLIYELARKENLEVSMSPCKSAIKVQLISKVT